MQQVFGTAEEFRNQIIILSSSGSCDVSFGFIVFSDQRFNQYQYGFAFQKKSSIHQSIKSVKVK